jgi:murein DD-endopeptidase MepM/ murein hydrolase activator NlpD
MAAQGRIGAAILIATLLFAPAFGRADTLDELRQSLEKKKAALQDTEERILEFQKQVQEKRRTAQTLKGQIELINDNIEELSLALKKTGAQIDATDVEVAQVEEDIAQKEKEIERQKVLLAQYIRELQELDMQSTVAIFLKYTTLSDAITESTTVEALQERAHTTIVEIQHIKEDLLSKKQELNDFKETLNALKNRQQSQKKTLDAQEESKQRVLTQTNAQEAQYQSQLEEAKEDAEAAERAISALDSQIRQQLEAEGVGKLPTVGTLDWPIEPIFGISCPFHCSGYPYAYLIGPHTGTDIPTPVGTPIKAPADGYVGRTHDSGGRGYSYIMLIHGDNISTVYGHVSGFAVKEGKFVKRGDTIGYTGGAPGSHGAGLSSGPHLHFEVRKNNVPVNAEGYLKSR